MGNAAAVDPGDGETQGLPADHVCELRLAGMQDLILAAVRVRDEIAEEITIRLVALRPLGGGDNIEGALQRRGREKVIVDVGDEAQTIALRQRVERRRHVGKQPELRESLEVARDQRRRAFEAVVLEGLGEG